MILRSKKTKQFVIVVAIILTCVLGALIALTITSSNRSESKAKTMYHLTYPQLVPSLYSLPDSVQYFYSNLDYRGVAPSSGEFFVKIRYPIFRLPGVAAKRYEDWLLDEIFILGSNAPEKEIQEFKSQGDVAGYAQSCLNSWLADDEARYLGCLQESLAVDVEMNDAIVTLKVSHGGYWGGAHGDASVQHYMFDLSFRLLDPYSLISKEYLEDFTRLLIEEYHSQVQSYREYPEDYILCPDSFALVPDGLIAHYFGWSNAEGKPTVLIKPKKFIQFLKPEYRTIYTGTNKAGKN